MKTKDSKEDSNNAWVLTVSRMSAATAWTSFQESAQYFEKICRWLDSLQIYNTQCTILHIYTSMHLTDGLSINDVIKLVHLLQL